MLGVGGRLDQINYPYDTKYPYTLRRKAALAELIVQNIHKRYFRVKKQFMVGYIRFRFYITGGALHPVKKTIDSCVRCARQSGITTTQLMGYLPLDRATPAYVHSPMSELTLTDRSK